MNTHPGDDWTRCDEHLPPLTFDGEWRKESGWVLAKTDRSEVWVAEYAEDVEGDIEPRWTVRGPDGYTLDNVIAWRFIP